MAKKSEGVYVRLSCILSGHPGDPGPGDVITVDADEAARLIDLGVAEAFTAAPESGEAAKD